LIENVKGLKEILGASDFKNAASTQIDLIKTISEHIKTIQETVTKMTDERRRINKIEEADKVASEYCNTVKPMFEVIRYSADKLELMVDDEIWPLPKYRELLFNH